MVGLFSKSLFSKINFHFNFWPFLRQSFFSYKLLATLLQFCAVLSTACAGRFGPLTRPPQQYQNYDPIYTPQGVRHSVGVCQRGLAATGKWDKTWTDVASRAYKQGRHNFASAVFLANWSLSSCTICPIKILSCETARGCTILFLLWGTSLCGCEFVIWHTIQNRCIIHAGQGVVYFNFGAAQK